MFILQLAAAITAFVLRGQVEQMVRQKIFNSMAEYKNIPGYYNSIDTLQNMVRTARPHPYDHQNQGESLIYSVYPVPFPFPFLTPISWSVAVWTIIPTGPTTWSPRTCR